MEVKFNSLFDNEMNENDEEYYSVNSVDTTLLLNNLILTFDRKSNEENLMLFERNFGNSKNYRLGPRSCSTRHASSDKFCEHPGLPEVYEEPIDKCKQYFMPNSSIGDRNQYLRNIDLEARILKMDYKDSKCDNKSYKDDMCNQNDGNCILNCGQNIFKNDNFDGNNSSKNSPTENNKKYCAERKNSQERLMKGFRTFEPTKRRDVLNW